MAKFESKLAKDGFHYKVKLEGFLDSEDYEKLLKVVNEIELEAEK